jgi:hypothetical protein
LAVIAGRPVVTREGLEVLLLASSADLPDGESIERTLDLGWESGGLVVLPWGFGKWLFSRGKTVARLLSGRDNGRLFVGDNGNRPTGLRQPGLIRRAEATGIPVIPGSDPFPPGIPLRACWPVRRLP